MSSAGAILVALLEASDDELMRGHRLVPIVTVHN